ncbi:uncharacterized protein LOC119985511 [Tripterygium wilfordii]|uniref:uncharacterized protein LOC119985511 n=1 Tax=Tripterygium wilfordii TaxID=458696 RepID=UPI0018F83052|nr:uncharacterized protein LOC119985511 [Tripterygium wilfordii]
MPVEVLNVDDLATDWREPIMEYLTPNFKTPRNVRVKHRSTETNYFMKWVEADQAEVSNKVIISMLEKMMDDNPRVWQKIPPKVVWAYRMTKQSSTGTSPFYLTYGHDAMLPMEIAILSLRVARHNSFTVEDYSEAMVMKLE